MVKQALKFFCFLVWIAAWLIAFGWTGIEEADGQQIPATCSVLPSGTATATASLTFTNYDQTNNRWNYRLSVQMTGSNGASGYAVYGTQGTATVYSPTGYAEIDSYATPSATYTLSATADGATGMTANTTVQAPPPPAISKTAVVTSNNPYPTPMVAVVYDLTVGAYVAGTAVQVDPGQNFSMGVGSQGDDLQVQLISQTLAQYNADSTSGTGQMVSVGGGNSDLVSGANAVAVAVQTVTYASMTASNPNGNGGPTDGSDIQQPTGTSTFVSGGAPVANSNTTLGVASGSGTAGAVIVAPFGPGTGNSQTGSTTALTDGQFNQGTNAIVKGIAAETSAITQAIGSGSSSSGLVSASVSGVVSVSNFPSSQNVNGSVVVSGVVSVSNMVSAISVSFPSAITVANMVSSISVTFPSEITVGNMVSGYSTVGVSNMISTTNIEGLISTGNGYLAGISNSISGTNTRLDKLISSQGDGYVDGLISGIVAATPTVASMTSGGDAGGSTLTTALGAAYDTEPTTTPTSSDASSALILAFPAMMGGCTFDLNPFESARLAPVCAGFRAAVAWLTIAVFALWAWKETSRWATALGSAQQARGNTVAGTGGQATAVIAAGLMTVATSTALVAFAGYLGDDWGLGDTLTSVVSGAHAGNPFWSMGAQSVWMLDQLFPIATLVAALVGRLVYSSLALKVYVVYLSTIRYIVP